MADVCFNYETHIQARRSKFPCGACSRVRAVTAGSHYRQPSVLPLAILLLAYFILFSSRAAFRATASELDAASVHRIPIESQMVWDEVNAHSDHHLLGVEPSHAVFSRSCFELQPGKCTYVRVPAFERVRIHAADDDNQKDLGRLQVSWSNGTGLFRYDIGETCSINHKSLRGEVCSTARFFVSQFDSEGVLRVSLPSECNQAARVRIFVSRRTAPKIEDIYRNELRCSTADSVQILDSKTAKPVVFTSLDAGESWKHQCVLSNVNSADKTTRIRVTTRLRYGEYQTQPTQTYWLLLLVDGQLKRIATLQTRPVTDRRTAVDGCETVTGLNRYTYLDLGCNPKTLQIIASQDVYLRVDAADPSLNNDQFHFLNSDPNDPLLHDWLALDRYRSSPKRFDDPTVWNPLSVQQTLQALSRDNSLSQSGLQAYMWGRAVASTRIMAPVHRNAHSVEDWVHTLRSQTQFIDLEPSRRAETLCSERKILSPSNLDFAKLHDPGHQLKGQVRVENQVSEPEFHSVVPASLLSEQLSALPKATFCDLPAGEPIEYRMPSEIGPSLIRVTVETGCLHNRRSLFVQMAGEPPVALEAVPTFDPEFAPRRPSKTDTLLSVFAHQLQSSSSHAIQSMTLGELVSDATWQGPYSVYGATMKTASVASITLRKPADVSSIRVWHDGQSTSCLKVAVQYLGSSRTQLSESSYLGLQCLLNASTQFNPRVQQVVQSWVSRERANNIFHVSETLSIRVDSFRQSVVRSHEVDANQPAWSADHIAERTRQASSFESDEQWPLAIEAYTQVLRHSRGAARRNAILRRIAALEQAGESMLANTERRGWLLHSTDHELRRTLVSQLLDQSKTSSEVLTLAAVARELRLDENASLLVNALDADGNTYAALQWLLQSPESERDQELLLQLAWENGWWRVFDEALSDCVDVDSRQFWKAQKHLRHHRLVDAKHALQDGSDRCHHWLQYLQTGRDLAALRSNTGWNAPHAFDGWLSWVESNPSPRRWRSYDDAIVKSAGTIYISSPLSAATAYQTATPTSPLEIAVVGPATLRLEARPLHPALSQDKLEGWIKVTSETGSLTQTEHTPVIANYRSENLTIDAKPSEQPGALETVDFHVGSGAHRIQVLGDSFPLAVRVLQSVPLITGYHSPLCNTSTLRCMVLTNRSPHAATCLHSAYQVRVIGKSKCQFLPIVIPTYCAEDCDSTAEHYWLSDSSLSMDKIHIPASFPPPEQSTALDRVTFANYSSSNDQVLLNDHGSMQLSIRHSTNEVQTHDSDTQTLKILPLSSHRRHAVQLARRAREAATTLEGQEAIVALRALRTLHSNDAEIRRLSDWVEQGSRWEIYEEFETRAGINQVQHIGWQPETPSTRIRKSLMSLSDDQALVLSGGQAISLGLELRDSRQFQLQLSRPAIGFVPLGDVEAEVLHKSESLTSNGMRRRLKITDQPSRTSNLNASLNQLHLTQITPKQNHYVAASLFEVVELLQSKNLSAVPARFEDLQPNFNRRTYQVALPNEPIQFVAAAPSILRIDAFRHGQIYSRTITVTEDQAITLEAYKDEPALYRVFELTFHQPSLPTYRVPPIRLADPDTWPSPIVESMYATSEETFFGTDSLSASNPNSPFRIVETINRYDRNRSDPYSTIATSSIGSENPLASRHHSIGNGWLSRQERGTWALAAGYQSRSPVEEFNRIVVPEQFFNTELQHFKKWERANLWTDSAFTVRPRVHSGTTFGYRAGFFKFLNELKPRELHSDSKRWRWSPWFVRSRVYAFHQDVPQSLTDSTDFHPWILGGSISLGRTHHLNEDWYHRPTLQIFGRLLSEDRNRFGRGIVDQDIFTPYKSDHPTGAIFSDRLVYEPIGDHRIWLSPRLVSNSDGLSIDNLGLQIGGDRLLGPLQLNLSYRLTGYFQDKDRSHSAVQNVIYADLRYEKWHSRNHRGELAIQFRNQLDDGQTTFGISYTGFWNAARLYQDRNPLSLKFRSQREERAAVHFRSPSGYSLAL